MHTPAQRTIRVAQAILSLVLLGCAAEASPETGVCIAPANPGGGWYLTCHATAEVLGSQAPGGRKLRVTNMPGDGGGVAFARVVADMRGNERVIVAASPSTLLGLVQHRYGALREHDVRWIAAVATERSVIAVGPDAPWHSLKELVDTWRRNPDAITIGGTSAIGGGDHMKMLLLARTAGIDVRRVRYVPFNGVLEVVRALHAGTIQVYPADVSKILRQSQRRELRVIAVLGETRAPGAMSVVPTAREQGFDVVFDIWRGLYAPAGISDAAYALWVERIGAMTQSPEWRSLLIRNGLTPFNLGGADFTRFVTDQAEAYRTLSTQIGIIP
jgi:putative tricarboxylic transport membrane protein